jgi:ABC-type transporter Mla subunit MlaD
MHMALAGVDRAVTALESFDGMIQTLDTESSTVGAELANAGRAFSAALHQASGIMTVLSEGQGTAGQLLTNPDLYNRLGETAKQLERLAESMRLMVEQIREEGVGPLISP